MDEIKNVVLKDDTLSHEDFLLPTDTSFVWSTISSQSNVTVSFPVIPKKGDIIANITHATITYNIKDDSQARVVRSNQIGSIIVMKYDEYLRTYSSHIIEWLFTSLIIIPCLLIPYLQWYNTKYLYKSVKKTQENENTENKRTSKYPMPLVSNRKNSITGEVNGPIGPEPTRYGDWERSGR
ncbi:hypothetical protein HZS_6843, partial [Henneguya salminicola]